jgi:uncharacterized protein (DUF342 family)
MLTQADVDRWLAAHHVSCGLRPDAIAKALAEAAALLVVADVKIAEGQPSRPGQVAPPAYRVAPGHVVLGGDVLATQEAPVPGVAGTDVTGTVLPVEEARRTLAAGDGAELDRDGGAVVAKHYGVVVSDSSGLGVRSLVTIAPDRMSAAIDFYAVTYAGRPIPESTIELALQAAGVSHGIRRNKIEVGLATVLARGRDRMGQAARAEVAFGTPPEPGRDAFLDYRIAIEKRAGTELAHGRIDLHDRGVLINVTKGQVICELHPATPARSGSDVCGKALAASDGKTITVTAGANVEQQGDQFVATIDGVVAVSAKEVAVMNLSAVSGDVDATTGHVRSDAGGVHVQGSVRSGFLVEAYGPVIVDQIVEDARIETRSDILVRGGVLHGDSGHLRAGGSATVMFAQNARIDAGGDIVVQKSALNCQLRAGGRIVATDGKGHLVGGTLEAGTAVDVKELGAASGVATVVAVGMVRPEILQVLQELEELRKQVAAVDAPLGADQGARASRPDTKRVTDLRARREQLKLAVADAMRRKHEAVARARAEATAEVIVRGIVHPGVTVSLFEKTYRFSQETRACRVRLDAETGEIVVLNSPGAAR